MARLPDIESFFRQGEEKEPLEEELETAATLDFQDWLGRAKDEVFRGKRPAPLPERILDSSIAGPAIDQEQHWHRAWALTDYAKWLLGGRTEFPQNFSEWPQDIQNRALTRIEELTKPRV